LRAIETFTQRLDVGLAHLIWVRVRGIGKLPHVVARAFEVYQAVEPTVKAADV
jgi:hypothetical protein